MGTIEKTRSLSLAAALLDSDHVTTLRTTSEAEVLDRGADHQALLRYPARHDRTQPAAH